MNNVTQPNFFSAGSPFLDHPLLTPERTSAEVDFVLAHTQLGQGGLVLDVGCGPGRHSIELSRRGYAVVGIDPSQAMIEAARQRAEDAGTAPEFIPVRGEEFSDPRKFNAVICLFTTLGQLDQKDDPPLVLADHPLLNRIARLLMPEGVFILEVPQRGWVIANLKESDRFGGEERYTAIQRSYDPMHKIVTEIFTLVSPDSERRYTLRYHLYAQKEIERLLINAGFKIVQTFGSFDAALLTAESPNMLFVARLEGSE